jgi:hypothetical protein
MGCVEEMTNMQRYLTISLLALTLLAVPAFGAQVSIGIRIGPPPPPPVVRVVPVRPAPEYVWVEGYWYPVGNHWKLHKGYWTRAPYAGAQWYAPRYAGGEYFEGYWEAPGHGQIKHNHGWDKKHERDYWESQEHEHGHDRK